MDPIILSTLLIDRTTNNNIIWATNNDQESDIKYDEDEPIQMKLIIDMNTNIIKPRMGKSKSEKTRRVRDKAEVFTPSWMCNIQNNLIDERWFEQKNTFNKELNHSWRVNNQKIRFPKDKTWKDYTKETTLEIACGEAPYIVSRYDTVTGKMIPVQRRIGLLDRKLRVICENTNSKKEWLHWAEIAYKSVYGYDWQGDNIIIARKNLLDTLLDYYEKMFKEKLEEPIMMKFAEIISWNIWQMDGVRGVIPNSCDQKCIGCKKNNIHKHNGKYCKIMDWDKRKKIKFVSLIKKEK